MVENFNKQIALEGKTPIIFDKDGNVFRFLENKTAFVVPDSLYETPLSLKQLEKTPYRIVSNYHAQHLAKKSDAVVYAPFPLGFWALHALSKGHFDKLVLDKPDQYHFLKCFFLRLILKNERRRMGSDVFSPFMMGKLRKVLSVADYFSITIGDWLYLTEETPWQINSFSKAIFWLDQKTETQKMMSFIHSRKE